MRAAFCTFLLAFVALNPSAFAQTEPPKLLSKNFLKNIAQDQKAMWGRPFHPKEGDARKWLVSGAITAGLIASDRWTSHQLPNTPDQIRYSGYVSKIGSVYSLVPIAGAFYLTGVLAHDAKARATGLVAAEALADGMILLEAVKLATQRQRPTQGDEHGHFFRGGSSFPSGHTVESFVLASVIAHEYPSKKVAILAYGLAFAVSASRFTGRDHFAADIVAPAGVGWLIGTFVFRKRAKAYAE